MIWHMVSSMDQNPFRGPESGLQIFLVSKFQIISFVGKTHIVES